MKRTSFVLTLLLMLVLVSCTTTLAPTPEPTLSPIPSAMAVPTLPPTDTFVHTATATAETVPTSLPGDVPTLTPTFIPPTATSSASIPIPTGRIYFFWDASTFTGGVPPVAPKQNLYLATPGNAYDEWQIQTLLEDHLDWGREAPSHPAVALSPDQTRVAFTVNRDANGDGDVDTPWGGDERDIYVYDLVNGSLLRVTGTAFNHDLDWLSDNNSIVFGWGKEVLQIHLNNMTTALLAGSFTSDVAMISSSPQGDMLVFAVNPSPSSPYSLYVHDIETAEEYLIAPDFYYIPSTLVWSPDGQWLLSNKSGDYGLILVEAQTGRVIWESDSPAGEPAWSLDSTQFAFVDRAESASSLSVFQVMDSTITQLVSSETMTSPLRSPDGTEISVGAIEERVSILYLVSNEGEINKIFSSSEIKIGKILAWSPDDQWLLFSGSHTLPDQIEKTGIFLIHRDGYPVHFLLETGSIDINIPPNNFFWLP